MLALVQRVKSGSVFKHKEKIESGLVIFVCLEDTDTESTFLKFGQKMENTASSMMKREDFPNV